MRTDLRHSLAGLSLLPIGGAIALAWANIAPVSYFTVAQALAFPVNDVLMALFFALITQEIVESVVPGGALHTWRRWTLPLAAAAGAIGGAALVYAAYVNVKYELVLRDGWVVPAAIDLAFAYFVVKVIFGRHPAVPFVLLLGIAVNIIGLLASASREAFVHVRPGGATLMAAALMTAVGLRLLRARTFWPYLLIAGPMSWLALYADGLNPAFALVPIVPFVPHSRRNLDLFEDPPHSGHDSPRHLEHVLKVPVEIVLFLFALVNAGVLLQGYGTGTWAVLTAALVGKPVGMFAATAIAVASGLHLPRGLHWRDLAAVAPATAGVFAFGLFFATAAYPLGPILGELKIGAILSGAGVPLAFLAARLLRVGRFSQPHHGPGTRKISRRAGESHAHVPA